MSSATDRFDTQGIVDTPGGCITDWEEESGRSSHLVPSGLFVMPTLNQIINTFHFKKRETKLIIEICYIFQDYLFVLF